MERIKSVDIVKGMAILVVVISHLISDRTLSSWITKLFGGLMGMFFIMSGYFYKPGKSYVDNVKKRFRQIVVPMLVYNAIVLAVYFIFETIFANNPDPLNYLNVWVSRLYDPYSLKPAEMMLGGGGPRPATVIPSVNMIIGPSWFLMRMFVSELIFYGVADFSLKSRKNMFAMIFFLLTVSALCVQFIPVHLPLLLESCFALTAAMLFGAEMKRINIAGYIEKAAWDTKKILITIFFVALYVIGAIYLSDYYGRGMMLARFGPSGGISVLIWFFCQIYFFYVMLLAGTLLAKIPYVSDFFTYLGKNTLILLLWHNMLGSMVKGIINYYGGYNSQTAPLWTGFIAVVFALAGSLAIAKLREILLKKAAEKKSAA